MRFTRLNKALFITLIIILAIVTPFFISSYKKLSSDKFYSGIYIEGINISNLSKEQANSLLTNELNKKYGNKSITVYYEKKGWPISLKSIGYTFKTGDALLYAYNLGRNGSVFARLRAINELKNNPANIALSTTYNETNLNNRLIEIKKQIDSDGKSSTYNYNCGKINYTNEKLGKKLDTEANEALIRAQLVNRSFNDVILIVSDVTPKFTVADVKDIKDVLASFTTNFNKYNSSRTHNIKLACNKINNFLLKPGEQFSMNEVLGPRTVKNGYMQAPIIINNELIPGTGGGVCQVTSTLYNAVLFSGLQVVQRKNHSITLGYIPPGQDATIAEGYIDFKFKNNRNYTICIAAEVKDNLLSIKIIGKRNTQEPRIVLKPVIIEEYEPDDPEYTIDNSLADNVKVTMIKEKKGMKIALYRQSFDQHGKLIKNEKISEDIYKPIKGEIAVNKSTYDKLNIN